MGAGPGGDHRGTLHPAVQKRLAQKAPQGFLEFGLFAGVDPARDGDVDGHGLRGGMGCLGREDGGGCLRGQWEGV